MALLHKNGRHAFSPLLFDRRQDPQFVVKQKVVIRRITAFDVDKLLLFVNVDQNLLSTASQMPERSIFRG